MVQVKRLVKRGSIDPQKVVIPGIMVDMVVVDENQAPSGGKMNPALTGEIRIPISALEPLPLDAAKGHQPPGLPGRSPSSVQW